MLVAVASGEYAICIPSPELFLPMVYDVAVSLVFVHQPFDLLEQFANLGQALVKRIWL